MVEALISAGADVNLRNRAGVTPLEAGIFSRNMDKMYPIFFRAGAALPTGTSVAYVRKIRAAGGFKRYERNHLNAITATLPQNSPPSSRRSSSAASSSTRSTRGTTKYDRIA